MEVGMWTSDVSPHPSAAQITPCPMHPVSRVDRPLLPELLHVSPTAWYCSCRHSTRTVGQAEVLKDHVVNNEMRVSGRLSTGLGLGGKKKFLQPPPPPSKGEPAKNLYTKSEILSAAERLGLSLNGVNLCNRQIMVLSREKQKRTQHIRGPGLGDLYLFSPSFSFRRHC